MNDTKNMIIEIISVGSELLSSHFLDTNSLFLAGRLNDLGFPLTFKSTVGDDWDQLQHVMAEGISRADLLFTIGGLGPTEDDRTKEALASVLGRKLILKKELLDMIISRFKRRGISMPEVNKKQAYIIEDSIVLDNEYGTAPGLWVETDICTAVLLPGPPHELKPMFDNCVLPCMQTKDKNYSAKKILKITGLTESKVDSLIKDLYPQNPDLHLSILAYPGQIEIHMTGFSTKNEGTVRSLVDRLAQNISSRLGDHVFTEMGEDLEMLIGRLLIEKGKTLAVAESCTGGFLSSRITDVPGSSDYFTASAVVYSNESKTDFAGVPDNLIVKHGAVSHETAGAMAEGIRDRTGSDYGLAITGIAGPGGGTPEKPVGLVYIALAWTNGTWIEKNMFLGNRKIIKSQSSQKALDMLRRHLLFGQEKASGQKMKET